MRHIKRYTDYDVVNEELNWWQKLLLGGGIVSTMLSPKDVSAQKNKGDVTKTLHKEVRSKRSAEYLQKQGWQLDSIEVDTLWTKILKSKPDTIVNVSLFDESQGQFFQLGKFELTSTTKDAIKSELEKISELGGIITNIHIKSSTDKVRIKPNGDLSKELRKMNLPVNNVGLAQARCNAISDYLTSIGVKIGSNGIVTVEPLSEQGKKLVTKQEKEEGDPTARLNELELEYIVISENITPAEEELVPKSKEKFYLSKDIYKGKTVNIFKHRRVGKINTLPKPLKKIKDNIVQCMQPGGM